MGISPGVEEYPEIVPGEAQLLALFPADFVGPQAVLWVGVDRLTEGKQFYGYRGSYQLRDDRIEIEVLRRYAEILSIRNPNVLIRQEAEYCLELLRDPTLPNSVTLGAATTLRSQHGDWSWGQQTQTYNDGKTLVAPAVRHTAEYLSDAEVEELVEISTSPAHWSQTRTELFGVFSELQNRVRWKPRRFDLVPFLEVLGNSSEDVGVRSYLIGFLAHMGGGPEVREVFQEMTLRASSTKDEEYILRRIRNSKLLKGDGR